MVILDKARYHDDDDLVDRSTDLGHGDAPPSYETISGEPSDSEPAFEKWRGSLSTPAVGSASHKHSQSSSSSWLSVLPFSFSRTSKQVRQTVNTLVRDLVLNAESPNLLDSCANACQTYRLDLSALLQEPSIEHHSAIYWAILNGRDALLASLLAHAAPLSQSTMSEIRLACLATANQDLFQSLRCRREPFTKQIAPLSTSPGTDALVLGSMSADEVSIREIEDNGAFVAEMRFNLWQKRMRVSGRVSVEFIARGRIWSLTFFSPPPTTAGTWQVVLCLLEHSPPTFVDSRLVIDLSQLPSDSTTSVSQAIDLISLSPPPDDPSGPVTLPLPLVSPSTPSQKSKSNCKARQTITVHLKGTYRLAHRASKTFLTQKEWSPPRVEQWTDSSGSTYTNAIVVPLGNGAGAELLYENSPFIAKDGTLHVRLEARLEKPGATECVVC